MIRWQQTPKGYVVYQSTKTGRKVRAWVDTMQEAGASCAKQHGKASACYALMRGDFDPETLGHALEELALTLDGASEEDYVDLAESYDDLRGIVDRILATEERR